MKKLFGMVVAAFALTGCVEPAFTPMAQRDVDNLLAHLYYGKDSAGRCYAVMSTEKIATGGGYSQSVAFTYIPCEGK
jgi:hypothetical protein